MSATTIQRAEIAPTLDTVLLSDDDTVDENNRSDGNQINKANNIESEKGKEKEGDEDKEKKDDGKAEGLKQEKKVRNYKPFDEDLLVSAPGLQRVYEEFPTLCAFRGRGSEAQDLQRLISIYKEWAFQLHPGLSFPDILSRMETLGSRGKIRTWLDNAREAERYRYIEKHMGVKLALRPQNESNLESEAHASLKRRRGNESTNEKENHEDFHDYARDYDDVDDDDDSVIVEANKRGNTATDAGTSNLNNEDLAAEIAAAAAMDFSAVDMDVSEETVFNTNNAVSKTQEPSSISDLNTSEASIDETSTTKVTLDSVVDETMNDWTNAAAPNDENTSSVHNAVVDGTDVALAGGKTPTSASTNNFCRDHFPIMTSTPQENGPNYDDAALRASASMLSNESNTTSAPISVTVASTMSSSLPQHSPENGNVTSPEAM